MGDFEKPVDKSTQNVSNDRLILQKSMMKHPMSRWIDAALNAPYFYVCAACDYGSDSKDKVCCGCGATMRNGR